MQLTKEYMNKGVKQYHELVKTDYNKNSLTLITCTRNSSTKQTVYILELADKDNY